MMQSTLADSWPSQRLRSVLFASIPLYGHLRPLQQQAKELARRGWNVQIASADQARPYFENNCQGVEFVNIGTGGLAVEDARAIVDRVTAEPDFLKGMMEIVKGLNDAWPMQYDAFSAVIAQHRPDIMVVDYGTTAALDAAEAAGVPFIVNNADLLPVLPMGLFPPANDVPMLLGGKSKHDFGAMDRFLAPLMRRLNKVASSVIVGGKQNKCRRLRNLPSVDYHKRLAETLVLVNSAFGIEYERPLPPTIQLVGPMIAPDEPCLTEEERIWIADGLPVVFVNLGTIAQPTREHVEKLAKGLESTDFRVLWVLRSPARDYLPDTLAPNVLIVPWVTSQLRVLEHANVRAFVSHCGTNSVQESLYAGTPIVGFPMFAAQRDMGFRITDAGVGRHLDKTTFTSGALRTAIKHVLSDDTFQRATQPIRKRFEEAGGVRRAADLIEAFGATVAGM